MPKGYYQRNKGSKTQSLSVRLQELTEEVRALETFRTTIDAYLAGSTVPKARRRRRTAAEMQADAATKKATPKKRTARKRKPAPRKKPAAKVAG